MKETILTASLLCTQRAWDLSIRVVNMFTSCGTKIPFLPQQSPCNSFRPTQRAGLMLKTLEIAVSDRGRLPRMLSHDSGSPCQSFPEDFPAGREISGPISHVGETAWQTPTQAKHNDVEDKDQ